MSTKSLKLFMHWHVYVAICTPMQRADVYIMDHEVVLCEHVVGH